MNWKKALLALLMVGLLLGATDAIQAANCNPSSTAYGLSMWCWDTGQCDGQPATVPAESCKEAWCEGCGYWSSGQDVWACLTSTMGCTYVLWFICDYGC